jgi:hypothetical protein
MRKLHSKFGLSTRSKPFRPLKSWRHVRHEDDDEIDELALVFGGPADEQKTAGTSDR